MNYLKFLSLSLLMTTLPLNAVSIAVGVPLTDNAKATGIVNCQETTYKNLEVTGASHLRKSKVKELLKVNKDRKTFYMNWALKAYACQINRLEVNGNCMIKNSVFKSYAKIHGSIEAHKSIFADNVFLAAKKSSFSSCKLKKNLIVKSLSSHSIHEQTIVLSKRTVVEGDITFEKEGGKVLLLSGSTVSGKVINGTIEKE